jgi:murein hydrolase activator
MIRLAWAIALWAGLAQAQDGGTAAQARAAADRLSQAAALLTDAQSASDQIAALTETVAAYEDGLASFREGLRRAAIRRQTIEADLAARSDDIATLLGVLQSMGRTPEPLLLLHPSGPLGTARSGMILAEITPALQAEADALRLQLAEVADIAALQTDAAALLQQGLDGASTARAALAQAVQDRTDPPRRFTEDVDATATLIAATDTLSAFANGLATIVDQDLGGAAPDASSLMGQLALPVPATILRGAGQADAAGTVRPGLILATSAGALVTAPSAATVRFQGPLLDYGQVIILEPAPDVLFVLAGMDQVMVQTGEVVAQGAPLALMGGSPPNVQAILTETTAGTGASRPETLYLEVRDQSGPVDPALWFLLE